MALGHFGGGDVLLRVNRQMDSIFLNFSPCWLWNWATCSVNLKIQDKKKGADVLDHVLFPSVSGGARRCEDILPH